MHEILDVLVEKGMEDGEEIIFPRKGEQPNDVDIKPGDLIFTITPSPIPYLLGLWLLLSPDEFPNFNRKDDDLYATVTVSLQDAIVGFTTTLVVHSLLFFDFANRRLAAS